MTGLSYTTSTQALTGTIGITAGSVSLFPGKTAFTATVKGFAGSYDINAQALSLSATEADFQVSSVLMVTASTLGFSLQPTTGGENVSITVGAATATFPKFGVSGAITALAITQDGFSLGSATLKVTKTVSFGTTFTIVNPSVTVTNFGYSISQGASFDGTVSVSADEIDLNLGSVASGKATGITGSLSFATADLGHFTFSAATVNLSLGSFLTLNATKISFDSAPAAGGDIASFGSVSATFMLPGEPERERLGPGLRDRRRRLVHHRTQLRRLADRHRRRLVEVADVAADPDHARRHQVAQLQHRPDRLHARPVRQRQRLEPAAARGSSSTGLSRTP